MNSSMKKSKKNINKQNLNTGVTFKKGFIPDLLTRI